MVEKNPEFYNDFRPEEIIQKKCTDKKLDLKKNIFSGDLGDFFFRKKVFWLSFLVAFSLNNSFRPEISKKFWIFRRPL